MLVRQIVEQGSASASNRADDVPTFLQKLGGHREAKTAGCPDQQDRRGGLFHRMGHGSISFSGVGDRT
jgi:hypothetical protein